jgi:hypothetical protein
MKFVSILLFNLGLSASCFSYFGLGKLGKSESNGSLISTNSGSSTMIQEEIDIHDALTLEEENIAREAELEEKAYAIYDIKLSLKEEAQKNIKYQDMIKSKITKIQARRTLLEESSEIKKDLDEKRFLLQSEENTLSYYLDQAQDKLSEIMRKEWIKELEEHYDGNYYH